MTQGVREILEMALDKIAKEHGICVHRVDVDWVVAGSPSLQVAMFQSVRIEAEVFFLPSGAGAKVNS